MTGEVAGHRRDYFLLLSADLKFCQMKSKLLIN